MEWDLQNSDDCIPAYRADHPCAVLVVDVPRDGGSQFSRFILEKVHDRVPSSRLIEWGEPGRIAILMPDTSTSMVARVADMVCVETAALRQYEHRTIKPENYPPLSAAPGCDGMPA